jgi:hypothetical protein
LPLTATWDLSISLLFAHRFKLGESARYAVPALLWGVTNNIAFYQYYLDPAAVSVLQNMKIPVTAGLLRVILSKHYSGNQWWAI